MESATVWQVAISGPGPSKWLDGTAGTDEYLSYSSGHRVRPRSRTSWDIGPASSSIPHSPREHLSGQEGTPRVEIGSLCRL